MNKAESNVPLHQVIYYLKNVLGKHNRFNIYNTDDDKFVIEEL